MQITYRDFIDHPYIHGCETSQQILKASSLQERVTKLALTILLWIPIINIGVHLLLKSSNQNPPNTPQPPTPQRPTPSTLENLRRSTCKSSISISSVPAAFSTTPLKNLAPHLSPINQAEKTQYSTNWRMIPNSGTLDRLARTAPFSPNYERMALMKVNDRKGSFKFFDLRKVETEPSLKTTLYCPFLLYLCPNKEIMAADSCDGWLELSENKDEIFINRLDNFTPSEFHLGSALVQFAIELSIKSGFKGRVAVCSTNGSAGFYYKLGFTSKDSNYQSLISEVYQNSKRTLDGGLMYLAPKSIEIWKEKIAKTPLLN